MGEKIAELPVWVREQKKSMSSCSDINLCVHISEKEISIRVLDILHHSVSTAEAKRIFVIMELPTVLLLVAAMHLFPCRGGSAYVIRMPFTISAGAPGAEPRLICNSTCIFQ